MAAKNFICPNGTQVLIEDCLKGCPYGNSCLARPTLFSLASSCSDRKLNKFSVTELIRGSRESYLMKLNDYAIDPLSLTYSTFGTAVHRVQELSALKAQGILTEIRLENDIATGQIDAYGHIFNDEENVICDYKVTTSYKAMKALGYGYHEELVPTGEFYKSGVKKGEPKYKIVKTWHENGRRDVWEWTLQQNFYRMLLEEAGYKVDGMYIQMLIRDFSTSMAEKRHIYKPIYIVKLNKISDHWLRIYFKAKRNILEKALITGIEPKECSCHETWNGMKCQNFCNVAAYCNVGQGYLCDVG